MSRPLNPKQKQHKRGQRSQRISNEAQLQHHQMRNLATLGFPAPDADHQKHASNNGVVLSVARLYIAIWMQVAAEGVKT